MAKVGGTGDTDNTSVNSGYGPPCVYNAQPMGGVPHISGNVMCEGQPMQFYHRLNPPSPVVGTPLTPPGVCIPGTRTIVPVVNATVKVNNKLVGVIGDRTDTGFTGGPRVLTGAGQYPTIELNSKNYIPPSGP